jgi:uncharacterized membrane protein YoaK (UPF0700 family)
MTETETEQFVKNLQQWGMTDEQKKIAKSKELGQLFGAAIGEVIVLLITATMIWAVLTLIFALNIAWIKVFGAYFLFNFLKNSIIRSLKK